MEVTARSHGEISLLRLSRSLSTLQLEYSLSATSGDWTIGVVDRLSSSTLVRLDSNFQRLARR
jgi:hypothetical protein